MDDRRQGVGFISHHEKEWGLGSGRVWVVVVGKFHIGYRLCPQGGVISTEDLEVGFSFLVDSFSFFIRLGVIGSGEGEIIVKKSS